VPTAAATGATGNAKATGTAPANGVTGVKTSVGATGSTGTTGTSGTTGGTAFGTTGAGKTPAPTRDEKTNPYAAYTYKRERTAGKWVFPSVMAAVAIALVIFISNLVFGFFGPGANTSAVMPSVDIWAVETDTYSAKTNDAIERKREVQALGGAGYLATGTDQCVVIENAYTTEADAAAACDALSDTDMPNAAVKKSTIAARPVTLRDAAHREQFEQLVASFYDNFTRFNTYIPMLEAKTITKEEVMNAALMESVRLQKLITAFDEIQANAQNPMYAQLLHYAVLQQTALQHLSVGGECASFPASVKNCVCIIIYNYAGLCGAA
jgi:hypothetical protein